MQATRSSTPAEIPSLDMLYDLGESSVDLVATESIHSSTTWSLALTSWHRYGALTIRSCRSLGCPKPLAMLRARKLEEACDMNLTMLFRRPCFTFTHHLRMSGDRALAVPNSHDRGKCGPQTPSWHFPRGMVARPRACSLKESHQPAIISRSVLAPKHSLSVSHQTA